METRAPYVLIGTFVLAAILAVFSFVYWLNNTGGIGPRTNYHVQFQGPVPGLLVGAGVLFNGIRVGEVTELGLAQDNPRFVNATISVASATPVRTDTRVGLDFQGLTGVPVVTLEGGTVVARSGEPLTLVAEVGAGQSMTQAARDALRRVDSVLEDNSGPLKDTIANIKTFSDGLARNTGKLDGILAGLEKMTGGGTPRRRSPTICARRRISGRSARLFPPHWRFPSRRRSRCFRRSVCCSRRFETPRALPSSCGPTAFRSWCRLA
ncbi:ABC-type transporter Mla subunit MlaD [Bradyrhizobium japonicum]|uniref:ABC-type transporter Mla subunit MlaD n=1 Tax=Bradyrhizobium japonicum TaxID=375 RepID=A0ABV2S6M1_BRAJP